MLWQAENASVVLNGVCMDYIRFGTGARTLVMIPGLSDGLRSVRGLALPMAFAYRMYAGTHTVYMFSQKRQLLPDVSTADMADDLHAAMNMLGIAHADVLGVSQGGMIAQQLAIRHGACVDHLVLAVTAARKTEIMQALLPKWIVFAQADDYARLIVDTAERSYTQRYLQGMRLAYPLLRRIGKPKDWARFLAMAQACLNHDALALLKDVRCPTLVIGGGQDRIVGGDASRELAQGIPGSVLHMYPELGHAAYEEAKDFHQRVLQFLAT